MIVGIDMHNVRDGGGVNYIRNLMTVADPQVDGFSRIVIFGASHVLAQLPDQPWLTKVAVPTLEKSLPWRLAWVRWTLPGLLRQNRCDVLYQPGGVFPGNFRPFVTISRNMMPFRREFWTLYPRWSPDWIRLVLLERVHAWTFSRADGMIFLSQTARATILPRLKRQPPRIAVIPHGADRRRFAARSRAQLPEAAGRTTPLRIVYPSRLEPYKHQLEVISAVASLVARLPLLTLDMYGPANPNYLEQVRARLAEVDPEGRHIRYHGEVANADLPEIYAGSDLLLFASSCENLPNIMIEALAVGIPILSSDRSPMPEIGRDVCWYFAPDDPRSIASAIEAALDDPAETLRRAQAGLRYAADYSWDKTARATFALLSQAAGVNNQKDR